MTFSSLSSATSKPGPLDQAGRGCPRRRCYQTLPWRRQRSYKHAVYAWRAFVRAALRSKARLDAPRLSQVERARHGPLGFGRQLRFVPMHKNSADNESNHGGDSDNDYHGAFQALELSS